MLKILSRATRPEMNIKSFVHIHSDLSNYTFATNLHMSDEAFMLEEDFVNIHDVVLHFFLSSSSCCYINATVLSCIEKKRHSRFI